MTSLRKQRARIHCIHRDLIQRRMASMLEDQLWDRMPAVGREFGSPDFDRLMEEDYRLGRGVFDPAIRQAFGGGGERLVDVVVSEERPTQPKMPV
ncbi:hypothetical protein [Pelomonas cellulosilytica]|uniref:Uncharacterized protein n=1 Tax=Pelomonas cellulosilytica TaxID=2906762 RepID=A0ABS8XXK2_9BURK|nr:hypothetical protein [Pelomonas sp. P8]MCE4555582.1 hypothetical protein [Pelomonas sp. P8]